MKNTKKFLSMLLVCCMLLTGWIPTKALSAEIDFGNSGNESIARQDMAGLEEEESKTPSEDFAEENLDEVSPENPDILSGSSAEELPSIALEATGERQTGEFYYEQKFDGVKVAVSAAAGVIPEHASVSIQPINSWQELSLRDKIQSAEQDKMISDGKESHAAIYNMYDDLQVAVDQTYAFDFEITYQDAAGNICVFEPKEGQPISVSMAIDGLDLEDVAADEMQKMDLFYVPDACLTGTGIKGAQIEGARLTDLAENARMDGNTITFDVEHFSVYAAALVSFKASVDDKKLEATERAFDIIQNYADPAYFLKDPYREDMTDAEYEELHQAALAATAGCNTSYEKIKAITGAVGERIYYDYKYLADKEANPTYFNPYEVYKFRRTVCSGYANLMRTMLISINIPCFYVSALNHAYNAAYDSQQKRFVLLDTTWCSQNDYTENGDWVYGGVLYHRFDMTPQKMAELTNHEIYRVDGLLDGTDNSIYYMLDTKGMDEQDYTNWSSQNWHLSISDARTKNLKAVAGFSNLEVQEVNSYAFQQNKEFVSIDLSNTKIKKIGYAAFRKCLNLKTIQFPSSLECMDDYACGDCQSLQTADLSCTRLTELAYAAFIRCAQLKTIKVPASLTLVDSYACDGCKNLRKLDLSNTKVAELKYAAFRECLKLTSVDFPAKLKKVDERAFYNCKKMNEINLYNTKLTEIGYASFYNCKAAKQILLPASLKKLGDFAFGVKSSKMIKTSVITTLSLKKIGYMNKKKDKYIWSGRNVTAIRKCTYQIKFLPNHTSASGTMKAVSCTYGKKLKLPKNQFRRSGYKFVGWNTKKDGKGQTYKNKASVKNLTTTPNKTVKLYAQWKKI